ncbi:MAG TPA: UDP-N-acetylmuramoyl-L-alanyl-D-glutamate--2,6-diaminopimelate ligase [Gemmatimonadota bacterium]|nr:UDP-N-acetylmuramoyl-L-alanyl-D-glutamate--2,6-diaminopimelate ligase [Gemmatimonadota bacterium]
MITTDSVEARLRARGIPFAWIGSPPGGFAALRVDSRRVGRGDLFCAIDGTLVDGHAFVAAAAAAGAAGAVVEREIETEIPLLRVPESRVATAHLAALAAGDPATLLRVVGVTGTNGKTTTTLLLRHLLGAAGPAAALGTLGLWLPDGSRSPRGRMTTPGPLQLNDDLAEARSAGAEWLTMEVSSHALDQRRVDAVRFAAALFTNLSREHLDYHPDMASYLAAKLRLLDHLEDEGVAIVNADDPAWRTAEFEPIRCVRFGLHEKADVRAEGVRHGADGSSWRLATPGGAVDVRLPLLGDFNVSNALGAAATAYAVGVSLDALADRLATAPQVPGRMETLAGPPGPLVVRDYAHTPDGMTRALAALRRLAPGRLTVVFGCGGDRDRGKRPLMGEAAVAGADRVIVTTDNPRTEPLERIMGDILSSLPAGSAEVIDDRAEAIEVALAGAEAGDVVLLAGKGHETYQDVGGEKLPFDEAAVVSSLIGGGG